MVSKDWNDLKLLHAGKNTTLSYQEDDGVALSPEEEDACLQFQGMRRTIKDVVLIMAEYELGGAEHLDGVNANFAASEQPEPEPLQSLPHSNHKQCSGIGSI